MFCTRTAVLISVHNPCSVSIPPHKQSFSASDRWFKHWLLDFIARRPRLSLSLRENKDLMFANLWTACRATLPGTAWSCLTGWRRRFPLWPSECWCQSPLRPAGHTHENTHIDEPSMTPSSKNLISSWSSLSSLFLTPRCSSFGNTTSWKQSNQSQLWAAAAGQVLPKLFIYLPNTDFTSLGVVYMRLRISLFRNIWMWSQ